MEAWNTEHFNDARDFLAALDLADTKRWPTPTGTVAGRGWAFRGQADAAWGLVPSAWRDPVKQRIQELGRAPNSNDEESLALGEEMLLARFVEYADIAGLGVAGHSFRHADAQLRHTPVDRWPDGNDVFALALAQHYGVPTRLLDWTYNPLVAAFFATIHGSATPDRLAVWAFQLWPTRSLIDFGQWGVRTTTAPTSTNRNLRAQAGLFSFYRGRNCPPGLENAIAEHSGLGSGAFAGAPPIKLTLPASEADRLGTMLGHRGIDHLRLFPSLKTAASLARSLIMDDKTT